MTVEQYNRATEIAARLHGLKRASRILSEVHLCHFRKAKGFMNRDSIVYLNEIEDILKRHEDVIIEEVKAEIDALQKEIETL